MKTAQSRRAALLLGLGGALAGCGFHPVYAPSGDNGGSAAGLAEIEVRPINERPGQILREALLGRFRTESGTPRHFELAVNFWITGEAQGILDFTQPTRIRLVGAANWSLLSHDGKQN
jgi:LPS-assembly lipoprotein